MNSTPVYIICLEKTMKDRCLPTKEFLSQYFSDVETVPAVTPDHFTMDDLIKGNLINPFAFTSVTSKKRYLDHQLTDIKQIACYLSHIKLWKECVRINKPIIIAEDDVFGIDDKLFRKNLDIFENHLPDDTDKFAFLLYPMPKKTSSHSEHVNRVHHFTGTMFYYITPSCAKRLLDIAFPITGHVDMFINDAMRPLDLKVYTPKDNLPFSKLLKNTFSMSTLSHDSYIPNIYIHGAIIGFLIMLIIILATYISFR